MLFALVAMLVLMSGWSADVAEAAGESCQYWIAPPPAGSDDNRGTRDEPWATLTHAAKTVPDNNCTVWVLDGTYTGEQRTNRRFSAPVTFKAVNAYRAHFENSDTVLNINGGRNLTFEGLVFRHNASEAGDLVVSVHSAGGTVWAENITFRNNVFHDAYANDLLKPYNGVRNMLVEGNLFYNQGPGEEHIDVNSATDVVIRGNIFFNDYQTSGRTMPADTKHFIIIKDSGGGRDGLVGSERIAVDGNIFLNPSGEGAFYIRLGGDGKPYLEAKEITIANNLFLGTAGIPARSVLGVSASRDVTFNNNTTVGDLPARAYAFMIESKGSNPQSENISFYNNIWSDPTGTMGITAPGDWARFAHGDSNSVKNLALHNNLYWNGNQPIPSGTLVDPVRDDPGSVVVDPELNGDHTEIILPNLIRLLSVPGTTIGSEFVRLVEQYGAIPVDSAAVGEGSPAYAPEHDILGRSRTGLYALGAYQPPVASLDGWAELTAIHLSWHLPDEVDPQEIFIEYTSDSDQGTVEVSEAETSLSLTDVQPYEFYHVTLRLRDQQQNTLTSSNTLSLVTSDIAVYLPSISGSGR